LPRVGPVWRGVVAPQPFIGFPYSPFLGSPFYSSPAYVEPAYVAPAYASPTYVVPQESRSEADLRYEVQRLRNEIEALRLERPSVLPAPPQLPEPAPVPPAAPTVLVFRDGLRMFIRNYAIIGQTLWVLDERAASKIALSDLDLETTQKENRTQGVRFPLPAR
jgi:hypothetical protein